MSKWTAKGKPKDGWYFDGECPKCGKTQVLYIRGGNLAICPTCNDDHNKQVKITEVEVK